MVVVPADEDAGDKDVRVVAVVGVKRSICAVWSGLMVP
jgi:hypothetical protein